MVFLILVASGSFAVLYPADPFIGRIWEDVHSNCATDFTLHDGFLFRDTRICIPDCSLRLQLVSELHNEGHVGHDRTVQLVSFSYF